MQMRLRKPTAPRKKYLPRWKACARSSSAHRKNLVSSARWWTSSKDSLPPNRDSRDATKEKLAIRSLEGPRKSILIIR